ncbi:unnamed protein product [Trifolium pratense]|uniref:Uncharacterized protein n=1 Tax=Trifolium pratense TaxID=57577 RepID=A0ACB0KAL3_TRIPR|nr:unnamed protein product [Trifolium pratense]
MTSFRLWRFRRIAPWRTAVCIHCLFDGSVARSVSAVEIFCNASSSATITNEGTCTDEFDEMEVRSSIKKMIKTSVGNLLYMTSNALAFVNRLSFWIMVLDRGCGYATNLYSAAKYGKCSFEAVEIAMLLQRPQNLLYIVVKIRIAHYNLKP